MNKNYLNLIRDTAIFVTGVISQHYINKFVLEKADKENDRKFLEQLYHKYTSRVDELNNNINISNEKLNEIKDAISVVESIQKKTIFDHFYDNLKQKLDTIKEYIKTLNQILESGNKSDSQSTLEALNDIEAFTNTNVIINNIIKTTGEIQKILDDVNISKSSILPNFNLEELYAYLDSLTILQEFALLHISIIIAIICIGFSFLAVFFGNEIIRYFNLENKYPSLNTYFKVRSTFQKYYLIWNTILLFSLCILSLTIDIITMYSNP